MRGRNPEPPRCAWCDRRFPNSAAVMAHEAEHWQADIDMRAREMRPSSRALAEHFADVTERGLENEPAKVLQ